MTLAVLDPEHAAVDQLTLTSVEGAEDFLVSALQDLAVVGSITVLRGAVRCRLDGPVPELAACRLFTDAGVHLPGTPADPGFLDPLRDSVAAGVLGSLRTADGPLRFRVGTDHAELRDDLVRSISTGLGWVNDPSGYDVNVTDQDGWWTAQVGALHWSRRFGTLERRSWSTTPVVAEVLTRLLKPTPGATVLDPTCGTATLLISVAENVAGCRLLGTDHDAETVAIAHRNLTAHRVTADVAARSATPFGVDAQSLDRVVANLPFGKQVGSHATNQTLYPALLHEIARTLTRSGRAVLLTEDKQLLATTTARTKGLKIIRERLLRYRGATPTAYVLTRTRR